MKAESRLTTLMLGILLILSGIHCGKRNIDQGILDHELLAAAAAGDTAGVEQALRKGARIEAKNERGETPLIEASDNGSTASLKLLLEKGANVDAKDDNGSTALVNSIRNSVLDNVALLLPKATQKDKNNALLAAAAQVVAAIHIDASGKKEVQHEDGNHGGLAQTQDPVEVETLKMLLANGADINARAENGDTALILAAAHGGTDVVRLLLDRGADSEAAGNNGWGAMPAAACECAQATMNDTLEIEKMLLAKRGTVGARDKQGGLALLSAAGWGRVWNVKLFLENGADIETRDAEGNTALLIAAEGSAVSTIDTVRLLLDRGAQIEAKNNHGDTPLILAASGQGYDATATMKLLLKHRANVHAQNSEGLSALDLAKKNGADEIVQLLKNGQPKAH